MRFIGNKSAIAADIKALLQEKGLLRRENVFFDACCGSGAVSDAIKDDISLVINDSLKWCVTFTRGRLSAESCKFEGLPFEPFAHLNGSNERTQGFIYANYSPGGSDRMYFTAENAARIDFFRKCIESWWTDGQILQVEYSYLLASLIESASSVANIAGVYGAFLKHWDPRAIKSIVLRPVEAREKHPVKITMHNARIEDLAASVECDILYLDPPYTQNQYGTQYHLLETLVRQDKPSLSPITGSRPTGPMRSDWSKDIKCHILLDKVLSETKAKHILISYSPDGFLSKKYISSVLKRYGKAETYECLEIDYPNYTNRKSRARTCHKEYLFYIEKKSIDEINYASPVNYIGSKRTMIKSLYEIFPNDIEEFYDIFGGGFNVGVNSSAKTIVYNDNNNIVTDLIRSFRDIDTSQYIQYVRRTIKKYALEKEDSERYIAARNKFNLIPLIRRDPRFLYALIMYGFNQQIRFNSDHDFNNPVGQRWFNDSVLEKLVSFARVVKQKNVEFYSGDFEALLPKITPKSFVYMDPPYRLTRGAYNDGRRGFGGWDINVERRLFGFAEALNEKGVRFVISYVSGHKGVWNVELREWVARNGFEMRAVPSSFGAARQEVVILNYGQATSVHDHEPFSEAGRNIPGFVNAGPV